MKERRLARYGQANDKGFLHEAECEGLQQNIDHR